MGMKSLEKSGGTSGQVTLLWAVGESRWGLRRPKPPFTNPPSPNNLCHNHCGSLSLSVCLSIHPFLASQCLSLHLCLSLAVSSFFSLQPLPPSPSMSGVAPSPSPSSSSLSFTHSLLTSGRQSEPSLTPLESNRASFLTCPTRQPHNLSSGPHSCLPSINPPPPCKCFKVQS